MKPELLDLIHLNTYVDYSANKATDEDIKALLSNRRMEFDKDYLDFLRQLNGFKMYQLKICGTKTQDDLKVEEVWDYNDYCTEERPELREYFMIGSGAKEFYAYHPKEKRYCSLEFVSKGALGGKAFENLDALLDWAIKQHAKRFSEETKIVDKKALLHITGRITSFLEARGFETISGNLTLNSSYYYERKTQRTTERILIDIQTDYQLRNKLSLTIGVYKRYNLIEDFFKGDVPKKILKRGETEFTIAPYLHLPQYQREFSEQEVNSNYEAITTQIISLIEDHALRALALYDNVGALDFSVNESLESTGVLMKANVNEFQKMIIAKLAGNPKYDEIFKSVKDKYATKDPWHFLDVAISLNEELQKVSPLKNGLLP